MKGLLYCKVKRLHFFVSYKWSAKSVSFPEFLNVTISWLCDRAKFS